MSILSPVVCALDLNVESGLALIAAADLAERAGGMLHLVTVRPSTAPDTYRAPSDPEAAVRAVVEVYVDRALGTGACARLTPRIVVVREEDAVEALVSYASEVAAGALVLGTHARQGVRRFRLGSVAEEAVRRSRCPVLVVPNGSAGRVPGPLNPVLVAVDPAEPSEEELQAACALADLYGAPLESVSVVSSQTEALGILAVLPAPSDPMVSVPTDAEQALRARAEQAGVALDAAHVLTGDPADEIVRLAEARGAGAVVMKTHGLRGVERVLFGSVTEAVLRQLQCPALAIRPGA